MENTMMVSVGIKALNEQTHIAQCLESALAAVAPLGGEVILADSGSTDRTIEIARTFPVRILQLANPAERSCGTGAQLAFQQAQGEFFYMLDGDMILHRSFLRKGIDYLRAHPDCAGVGGIVHECSIQAEEFQIRDAELRKQAAAAERMVNRLDCGGLYRMAALREVGYFADRNLHAFEEFELGVRLRARGWKLARIEESAVDHYGHAVGGYRLLTRRIRSGYSGAPGEVVRGAIGHPHWRLVLTDLRHVRHGLVVFAWWITLLAAIISNRPALVLLLVLAPLIFLTIRRRSPRLGFYSLVAWNVSAASLLAGFFRKRRSPGEPVAAIDLTPAAQRNPANGVM